jgi:superfamily II DNA or RNA helicase
MKKQQEAGANVAVLGGALFFPPGCPAIPHVRKALTYTNPAWIQARRMEDRGKMVTMPEQFICGAVEIPSPHPWAGGLMAPRHLDLGDEKYFPQDMGLQVAHKMTLPDAEPVFISPNIQLRDYQVKAVESASVFGSGFGVCPTGGGKTTIAMGIMAAIPTRALAIVDTIDLVDQWYKRCASQLVDSNGNPVKATIVGMGQHDASGRLVVSTYQTLSQMSFQERYEFGKQFGLVFLDEAHVIAARSYSSVVLSMPAQFRVGLTATPFRHDKLDAILFHHLPIKLFEVPLEDLEEAGAVKSPSVKFVRTGWEIPELFRVNVKAKLIPITKEMRDGFVLQNKAQLSYDRASAEAKHINETYEDYAEAKAVRNKEDKGWDLVVERKRYKLPSACEPHGGLLRHEAEELKVEMENHLWSPDKVHPKRWGRWSNIANFRMKEDDDWSGITSAMCRNNNRNALITRLVRDMVQRGHQVMILTERRYHCTHLEGRLNSIGLKAVAVTAKVSKKRRHELMEAMRNNEYQVLICTQLADKGLDIPSLSGGIFAVPTNSKGRLQQRRGRYARPYPGKLNPEIVDLVDADQCFENMRKKRSTVYSHLNMRMSWG